MRFRQEETKVALLVIFLIQMELPLNFSNLLEKCCNAAKLYITFILLYWKLLKQEELYAVH